MDNYKVCQYERYYAFKKTKKTHIFVAVFHPRNAQLQTIKEYWWKIQAMSQCSRIVIELIKGLLLIILVLALTNNFRILITARPPLPYESSWQQTSSFWFYINFIPTINSKFTLDSQCKIHIQMYLDQLKCPILYQKKHC